ncbi:VOC family protein [Cellulomonas sp. ATA003]|uniref:VOC family protein n=1 Tax=Cellulomonas sp. ATA003 TaxID=3073064 RepID=UPI0028738543|nr:VOC family protein [Cellulomonas sp. ATA003]WNB86234.1 VOC family protein [Cellulomonas sp. ATA003]
MASLPLDARTYLSTHLTEDAVDAMTGTRATVGHVHLQVGDLAAAERFYVDALGFRTTLRAPGALFVSAGGYHHHLAVNTWNSLGAGPRASTLGLGEVAITVPTREEVDAVAARLRERGLAVADDGATVRTQDPWLNSIAVTVG